MNNNQRKDCEVNLGTPYVHVYNSNPTKWLSPEENHKILIDYIEKFKIKKSKKE
jgi:hypothetical protein